MLKTAPGPLSPAQAEAFLERGVVTIDTPLRPGALAAATETLDRLIPFVADGPEVQYRRGAGEFTDGPLIDVIQHPFFEDVARQVLRAQAVRFYQTAAAISYPQPHTPFSFGEHVDVQYCLDDWQATPRRVICSFFLWLNDVNERRAPMMLRPGSHRLLAEENQRRQGGREAPAVRGVSLEHLPQLAYAPPVPLIARAGQVSVLTTAAVHGASINLDDAPRKVMILTFTAAGVEVGLPPEQAEGKRQYDQRLRPLLRPERRHLVAQP